MAKDIEFLRGSVLAKVIKNTGDPDNLGRVQILIYDRDDPSSEDSCLWADVATSGIRPQVEDKVWVIQKEGNVYLIVGIWSSSDDMEFGSSSSSNPYEENEMDMTDGEYVSGGNLVDLAFQIVSKYESSGNYGCIVSDDNGYGLTIGIEQRNGSLARSLIQKIKDTDESVYNKYKGGIRSLKTSWGKEDGHKYVLNKGTTGYKNMQKMITTDVGKKCQDDMFKSHLKANMDNCKKYKGITDAAALLYMANLGNIYDCYASSGKESVKYTSIFRAMKKPYDLDSVYNASMVVSWVYNYKNRHQNVYKDIQALIKSGKLVKGKNNLTSVANNGTVSLVEDKGYIQPIKNSKFNVILKYGDDDTIHIKTGSTQTTFSKSKGIFYEAKSGTKVYASCDMKIKNIKKDDTYGTQIICTPIVSSGADLVRQAICKQMYEWKGKNHYSQTNRDPTKGGGDCSSTVHYAYKLATSKMSKGNNKLISKTYSPGSQSQDIWDHYKSRGFSLVRSSFSTSDKGLLPADVLCYKGHIEMYVGNGNVLNHGGGIGPREKTFARTMSGNKYRYRGIIRCTALDKDAKSPSTDLSLIYSHLKTTKIKKGDTIKQGDIIGTVGNSGLTNGKIGVFFQYKKNGSFNNPDELDLKKNK